MYPALWRCSEFRRKKLGQVNFEEDILLKKMNGKGVQMNYLALRNDGNWRCDFVRWRSQRECGRTLFSLPTVRMFEQKIRFYMHCSPLQLAHLPSDVENIWTTQGEDPFVIDAAIAVVYVRISTAHFPLYFIFEKRLKRLILCFNEYKLGAHRVRGSLYSNTTLEDGWWIS